MIFVNIISYILVIVGGLNWGLFGVFNFNLVGWIFQGARSSGSITIYVIITLAALWLIVSPFISGRGLLLSGHSHEHKHIEGKD
jgi:uncharacterized membrane protein YuzA (DUF378 family)